MTCDECVCIIFALIYTLKVLIYIGLCFSRISKWRALFCTLVASFSNLYVLSICNNNYFFSGEYLAIAVSFEHMSETTKNARAAMLGKTLNKAIERLLENQKSPGRKVCMSLN